MNKSDIGYSPLTERVYLGRTKPGKPNPEKPQEVGGQVERIVMCKLITKIYNSGYLAGHNDTVDGCFTDIYQCDMDTWQEDIVAELLEDLQST